jgi:hypothetical protein
MEERSFNDDDRSIASLAANRRIASGKDSPAPDKSLQSSALGL